MFKKAIPVIILILAMVAGVRAEDPNLASGPNPSDGSIGVSVNAVLQWQPSQAAIAHDVYFGTSPTRYRLVSSQQPENTYTPSSMDVNVTYYWRVDEFDGVDTWQGVLWSFTTGVVNLADINQDEFIDEYDLAIMAADWLKDCSIYGNCQGTDIYPAGGDDTVDFGDYAEMVSQWEPEYDPNSPYPLDELTPIYRKTVNRALDAAANANKGCCLIFGAGAGRLAYEFSKRTEFRIIGVEEDANKVNLSRTLLNDANVYGEVITIHNGSLSNLRYRDYAAAIVVSESILTEGVCTGSAAEMFRMVKPEGGFAMIGQPLGCPNELSRTDLENWLNAGGLNYTITEDTQGLWAKVEREALSGAGEWTSTFGNPANTSCSGDTRIGDDSKLLWFGEPGPYIMIDTHKKVMSPLYKSGKLIIAAQDRFICVDAYNGARLWDLNLPNSSRTIVYRDGSPVAIDDYFYVAVQDDCYKVDLEKGQIVDTYHPPAASRDWGYLAISGDLLIGSEQIVGASYIMNGPTGGDNAEIVTSKSLFCLDKSTGDVEWTYSNSNGSVIANPTICVSHDAVYFFESSASGATGDGDGRVTPATFCNGSNEYLVKLNKYSGDLVWRKQKNLDFRHCFYLSYSDGIVLAAGSSTISDVYWYHYHAFNSTTGNITWEKNFSTGESTSSYWATHNVQDKHPMIIGDTIYLKFGCYKLQTGTTINRVFTANNCSDFSASANRFFGCSSGRVGRYRLDYQWASILCSETRPGCFISVIPAGGLIMLPPYNAGCTCDYSIQTTFCWLAD